MDFNSAYVRLVLLAGLLFLPACRETPFHGESGSLIDAIPPVRPLEVWQPEPGTSWQLQYSGTLDTSHDVDMYDIDLFDTSAGTIDELHAQGRIVICYFSAGTLENWRPDAALFAKELVGKGNGWPGERWLDIRALDRLKPAITARLELAVQKRCDGVDPDNVDAYINDTGFALNANDQIRFNRWLADEAHRLGLSIGLKNNIDQIPALQPWFDWALNEQCHETGECARMRPFVDAGKAVFGIEYTGDPATVCEAVNAHNYDWLFKSLSLGSERLACR